MRLYVVMRHSVYLYLLISVAPLCMPGTEWFVAPNGQDAQAGMIDAPFASIARAQQAVSPGDTVSIRGGTYVMTTSQIAETQGLFARCIVLNKSGTAAAPIHYRAYQDEIPVFDFSQVRPADCRITGIWVRGDYIQLIGLSLTGVQVTMLGHTQSISVENTGNNNHFERLRMYDSQAIGFYMVKGRDNLILNCDAWSNWDYTSEDKKGGNVDGFGCHPQKGSTGNIFRGCRAWYNSDDGYDCINAHEVVRFENCWAMANGQDANGKRLADGNGFKAGGYGSTPKERLPTIIPRNEVVNCIAILNRAHGFYANHHPGGCDWIANTAYRNGSNFNMLGRLPDNKTDIPGKEHVLRRNIAVGSQRILINNDEETATLDNNYWSAQIDEQLFHSVDVQHLYSSRGKLGQLPNRTCLLPRSGSVVDGLGALPPESK